MDLWFHRNSVDFKNQHNFGVYDLYGKGSLTGCGLRGHCLVSFLYKKKKQFVLKKHFLFFSHFVISVHYRSDECWTDYVC